MNAESIIVGGPFTGAFSTTEGFTDEQRMMVRGWLQRGYDRFTTLVSEGRGLSLDQVDEIARSRVWPGVDAAEIGLVDELGGLTTAIAKARELAEIDPESDVRLKPYPSNTGGFAFLGASSSASVNELKAIGQLAEIISDPEIQALISEAEALRETRVQARMPSFNER